MASTILRPHRTSSQTDPSEKRRRNAPKRTPTAVLQTAKLYRCCDMEKSERIRVADGLAVVYSSRCPGKASSNEDTAAIYPVQNQVGVLAVADGHGIQE